MPRSGKSLNSSPLITWGLSCPFCDTAVICDAAFLENPICPSCDERWPVQEHDIEVVWGPRPTTTTS